MRGLWYVVIALVVAIFTLSNNQPVTVTFWKWRLYTGPLALAVVGAGVLGVLLTYLPSLLRHAHLSGRIRELERTIRAHEQQRTGEGASGGAPSETPTEEFRRLP